MDRLKDWLVAKQGPKFVISPSMLLPRHRRAVQRDSTLEWSNLSALHSDSWDGYPNTLREVLAYIAAKKIRHVVFLSGDEHRGWVAAADLFDAAGNPITRVHSIHSAAIYAPFPFANSIDEDLVEDETIDIVHEGYGNYRCVVKAMPPPPGDGMTFLFVRQVAGTWQLDYEFADGMVRTLSL
jgi:phosphodiesterase/alkaline phosphatase D-like protein